MFDSEEKLDKIIERLDEIIDLNRGVKPPPGFLNEKEVCILVKSLVSNLAMDNRISAIKCYRQLTRTSLYEAKSACEAVYNKFD